ncbi:hypothetical protein HMPREF3034_01948 [Prevotella sp. DNF00663]|nr:hypothetical protein HMPREF3034_01948 [Prevotella sp. DNF00663]
MKTYKLKLLQRFRRFVAWLVQHRCKGEAAKVKSLCTKVTEAQT